MAQRGISPPISLGDITGQINPTAEPKAKQIFQRWVSLKNKRSNWEAQWQSALRFLVPQKAFITRQRSIQGEQLNVNIFDTTARMANQRMASGFQGNLTNPATRWFRLRLQNQRLNEPREVKVWLAETENIMFDVFSSSNFDEQIHECYIDLGSFGTSVLFETEDEKDIIRFRCMPVSEVAIGEDSKERIIEVFRQYSLTAIQAWLKWGDSAGEVVLNKIKNKQWDQNVQFIHAVFPRFIREVASLTRNNLPWASVQMELSKQEIVDEGGFHENPFMVTRFMKVSGDPYGYSPGIVMLPDIKMLQSVTQTIIRSAQKIVDPPLILPHDGFLLPLKTMPAGINFKLSGSAADRIEPLETKGNIPVGRDIQNDIRAAINNAYFVDLFRALADRRNMTATEVVERVQENALQLGPVLGRLQSEMLDPIIERTFNILLRKEILPPPPSILEGQEITVEYISQLANAQRISKVSSVTNLLTITNGIAQVVPEVIDKIDTDKVIDNAAEVFGVSPDLIRNAEQVATIRQQRAEVQAAINQAQQIVQGIETVKTASEANKNLAEAEEATT